MAGIQKVANNFGFPCGRLRPPSLKISNHGQKEMYDSVLNFWGNKIFNLLYICWHWCQHGISIIFHIIDVNLMIVALMVCGLYAYLLDIYLMQRGVGEGFIGVGDVQTGVGDAGQHM